MPRHAAASDTCWPLPGEKYGYVEPNDYGMAELRYKGRRRSLAVPFDPDNRKEILRLAKVEFIRLKKSISKPSEPKRPRTVTTKYAEDRFREDREITTLPYGIRASYDAMFRHFLPLEIPLDDDALYDHLAATMPALRRKLAPSTLANMTGRFDAFVRYCIFRKWLSRNPWDGGLERPKKPMPEEKTPLTPAQITALYRYCLSQPTPKWKDVAALLQLFNAAAPRVSEAISLHWADMVNGSKTHNVIDTDRIRLRRTKNGEREIPYGGDIEWLQQIERAVRRLARLRTEPTKGGRQRTRVFRWRDTRQAIDCIGEAFKAVGIPTGLLKGHLFRTTVEKRWMDAGVSETTVVRIVGHTTETRRRHYRTQQTAEDTLRELKRDLRIE